MAEPDQPDFEREAFLKGLERFLVLALRIKDQPNALVRAGDDQRIAARNRCKDLNRLPTSWNNVAAAS